MLKFSDYKKEEKQTANQQLVKETNRTLVFNLINKHGPVSRAELAHATGLSPTTVSSLADDLIKNEIIYETGEGSTFTSGRKPIMLDVNPGGGFVFAVEVKDTGFESALYDLKCRKVYAITQSNIDFFSLGYLLRDACQKALDDNKLEKNKLFGICIGVPGIIDLAKNRIIKSTVVPIEYENDFYNIIKNKFSQIPVYLGNESWFSAYAQKEFGQDGYIDNLIFIDINKGVGSGLILNGKIYTGTSGIAGETGHMSVDLNGEKCKCGSRGCLETMISIPAIIREHNKAAKTKYDDISQIPLNELSSSGVLSLTAKRLAFGLNNIINFVNPQAIIIGGSITQLGEVFLDQVKDSVQKIQLKPGNNHVKIAYSKINENTVTLGGGKYLLDNILNPGILLNDFSINI